MPLHLIKTISLDSICLMIKNKLCINYTQMAAKMGWEAKTISRWRKGEVPYRALSDMQYRPLFDLIESSCKAKGVDFVFLLTSWFPELEAYHDKDELKRIIKNSLDYHINGVEHDSLTDTKENNVIIFHSKEFLESCLTSGKSIDNICMAFHSGWDWLKNKEKNQLLEQLNSQGIKLRVIVNHRAAIRKIAKSMSDPNLEKFYIGFNEGIRQWDKCASALGYLDFRVSDYPILRKVYIINYKDGTSEALVRDYAYDFSTEFDFANIHLTNNNLSLKIFQQEFEFLWKNAMSYTCWAKALPKQEEILSAGEYVLLYLSYGKRSDSSGNAEDAFVISALQVGDNNDVRLDVNVADSLSSKLRISNPEYSYEGSIKMTRSNIFMTLFDKSVSEQISISIARPLHEQNRFLGIMTGLSPQAQPVAFKCACIGRSVLPKLNIQILKQILRNNNQKWGNSLMVFEERDINLFYSKSILIEDKTW